jgi:hypothetical protein
MEDPKVAKDNKPQPRASGSARKAPAKKARSYSPSQTPVIRTLLDDLAGPLTQADAAELYAVKVVDICRKFDPFWFGLLIDLATHVVRQCDERDVGTTLKMVVAEPDGMQAHLLRRRINRNLPVAPGDSKLTETERYELARAILVAACDAVQDQELWDALWGRKADWSPVVITDREPAASPVVESEPS